MHYYRTDDLRVLTTVGCYWFITSQELPWETSINHTHDCWYSTSQRIMCAYKGSLVLIIKALQCAGQRVPPWCTGCPAGPYLSLCCKLWSVEGQQYWWRLMKLWTVRLVGNRAAQAALAAAVGVVGAEVGCPEIDDGRTLTGRTRDGRHTRRRGESRETDIQTVSARAEKRGRERGRQREHWLEAAHWKWQIREWQWRREEWHI